MSMERVSRSSPCIVCKKNDWCLIGDDIVICMRVQSPRQHIFSDGSVGFIHKTGDAPAKYQPKRVEPQPKPIVNCGEIIAGWQRTYGDTSLTYLAKSLGVTRQSLELVGCAKAPGHSVWGFPMFDARRSPIGIRMRHENGKKWAWPGSSNGLFIPSCPASRTVAICEGPTDTAAALTIGVYAIGKFNNCGGVDMIIEFIKLNKIREAIIVADTDNDRVVDGKVANPGISGAMALSRLLPVRNCVATLPTKDIREFVKRGGSAATLKAVTSQLVWQQPEK